MGAKRDVWSDVNDELGQLTLIMRDVGSNTARTVVTQLERAGWRAELRPATSGTQPGWSR